ncbi:MAG TPA: hypothetical protein VEQ60_09495 [Longimicrobium sp.]|nr:hypothetical protein [Longimicrobium sp.]
MSSSEHSFDELFAGRDAVSRRSFLMSSVTGAAALTLAPFRSIFAAEAVQVSAVLPFVGRFAYAIGTTVVADLVSEYVRQRGNTWLTRQINQINDFMYRGNFIDFTRSRVRSTGRGILYPVVHRDRFNTCVAFHNVQRPDPQPPMIEGPTVVGLTLAAEEIARNSGSQRARQILYPTRTISRGQGVFEGDYATPDVYETEGGGRLAMNYRNAGPGRGSIAVFAEGPVNRNEWGTLFSQQYSVNYA